MSLAAVGMRRALYPALSAVGALVLISGCTSSTHASAPGGSIPATGAPSVAVTGSGLITVPNGSASAPPTAPAPTPAVSTHSTQSSQSSKPVPAPSSGNIHQTVPSRPVTTATTGRPGRPASFDPSMTVTATAIRSTTAKGRLPGEISGPAVEIVLRFTNSGTHRVDLNNAVVTASGRNGDPATTISGPPARAAGEVAPHSSRTGTYVFTLAKSQQSRVTIDVTYSASAPTVVIVGSAR
jgi:hypothetical protein